MAPGISVSWLHRPRFLREVQDTEPQQSLSIASHGNVDVHCSPSCWPTRPLHTPLSLLPSLVIYHSGSSLYPSSFPSAFSSPFPEAAPPPSLGDVCHPEVQIHPEGAQQVRLSHWPYPFKGGCGEKRGRAVRKQSGFPSKE